MFGESGKFLPKGFMVGERTVSSDGFGIADNFLSEIYWNETWVFGSRLRSQGFYPTIA